MQSLLEPQKPPTTAAFVVWAYIQPRGGLIRSKRFSPEGPYLDSRKTIKVIVPVGLNGVKKSGHLANCQLPI